MVAQRGPAATDATEVIQAADRQPNKNDNESIEFKHQESDQIKPCGSVPACRDDIDVDGADQRIMFGFENIEVENAELQMHSMTSRSRKKPTKVWENRDFGGSAQTARLK